MKLSILLGFATVLTTVTYEVLGQVCAKTHPYVGFTGKLTTIEAVDGLSGTVTILDDCTFQVTSLSLLAGVPKVYWWGNLGGGNPSSAGFRISNTQLSTNGYSGQDAVTFKLDAGKTWSNFDYLFGYCEEFNANLAQLALGPGTGGASASAPASAPAPSPSSSATVPSSSPTTNTVTSFSNCLTLFPGIFNVHWTLDRANDAIEIGLEIVANKNNTWAGFGISDPSLAEANMVGSDSIITGVLGDSTPFAMAYYINARSQCDYAAGSNQTGVCPNKGNNTRIVGSYFTTANDNNIRLIRYRRSLSNTSAPDVIHTINPDIPMFVVFAYGPLSEDVTKPVILYHGPNHANKTTTIQFGLNPGNLCQPLSPSSAPAPSNSSGVIQTIAGITTFNVTIGSNKNYPNPPGWGISYHINGLETPILNISRGIEYTFIITAGPTHPLYITSSVLGGNSEPNQTIYAGGAQFAGDDGKPVTLKWTPNASTPNLVYYQCYTHQKLGWKINILDRPTSSSSSVSIRNSGAFLALAMVTFFMVVI